MKQKEFKIKQIKYGSINHGLWSIFNTKSNSNNRKFWNKKRVNIQIAWEKGTSSKKGKIYLAFARYKRIVNRLTKKSRS